jgi:23S rRNA pseudouridine1911/1915/1917 synthase
MIDYLIRHYSGFTQAGWLNRIESGRVLLDGIPSNPDTILRPGGELSWMCPPWEEPEVPRAFAILFRGGGLLAVAKLKGLPTMPGGGGFMENTLLSLVRNHFPGARSLHRLGRGTSGVVWFATRPGAASQSSPAWHRGEVLKIYRALASGSPATVSLRLTLRSARSHAGCSSPFVPQARPENRHTAVSTSLSGVMTVPRFKSGLRRANHTRYESTSL